MPHTSLLSHCYRHPILFALGYLVCYLTGFFLLEQTVVPQYMIHCPLDDLIPFCEWFLIPYASWFLLLPGTLLVFLFRDRQSYFYLCFTMFTGMTLCLIIYALFPNGLDLRAPISGDNLLCQLVTSLWAFDTSTNVCPSIPVASPLSVQLAIRRSRIWRHRRLVLAASWTLTALILLSTLFLRQHSVIDVVCGVALAVALHLLFSYPLSWTLPQTSPCPAQA